MCVWWCLHPNHVGHLHRTEDLPHTHTIHTQGVVGEKAEVRERVVLYHETNKSLEMPLNTTTAETTTAGTPP